MDRAMLIDSVNTMLRVATEIFISQNPIDGVQKRLKIEGQQDDEDPNP
jgi:hypothetical protein